MKRCLILLLIAALLCPAALAEGERAVFEVTDYLAEQAQVDQYLQAEAEAGYDFENPMIIVNPYGRTPLSALAIFTTESETGGSIRVRGKAAEDDICGSFPAAKTHFVPIYGLYAGDTTAVELTLDDGRSTALQIQTEPVNFNYYSQFSAQTYRAELYDHSAINICAFIWEGCYAGFDSKGDLRWLYKNTGACGLTRLQNGRLLIPSGLSYANDDRTGVRETDMLGKVYNDYVWDGGQHHDLMQLPNGNYLVLANTPGLGSILDYLVEIEPESGELVWEMALDTLVQRDDSGAFGNAEPDWNHSNAVCYDEASDTLIVSCRNQDALFGIRKSTKELVWVLGDPAGWTGVDESKFFTPVGDDFSWQYGMHNVSLLPDGSLLLFDNGYGGRCKPAGSGGALGDDENYSRAVRYRIDTENMTIEQLWEHGRALGAEYYCSVISGASCLDLENETYFITFGSRNPDFGSAPYTNNVYGTALRYLQGDELIWEMTLRGGVYRTHRLALYAENMDYDVQAVGTWHGDLGVTPEIDAGQINPSGAQPLPEGAKAGLYPFGALFISGTFTLPDEAALENAAVVLIDGAGMQRAYDFNETHIARDGGVLVLPKSWVSTRGLPAGEYAVYLALGNEIYDAECSIIL